jgi:xanthine dehydrogenase YagS FAD-binding subunit
LAPALISLEAQVRIVGPESSDEQIVPIEQLYRIPRHEGQREHALLRNQLVTHLILPPYDGNKLSATYEVRHGEGPDAPLAAASVCLDLLGGICQAARVVLGQVAPVPWISMEAERALQGQTINESTAGIAGREALASATPLSHNEYKVQQAEVAVKRAILSAVGLDTGGF